MITLITDLYSRANERLKQLNYYDRISAIEMQKVMDDEDLETSI